MKVCPIRLVYPTSRFRRSFRKLSPRIQNLATRKDQVFRKNAFDPSLKTHKLKGKLKGFWSYWVNDEYRVAFEFVGNKSEIRRTPYFIMISAPTKFTAEIFSPPHSPYPWWKFSS